MDVEKFPEVVELNVGGKLLTTLLSTLRKEENSLLAAMFSGRHQISRDRHGRYFIDYDGNVFENILNYLRHGSISPKEKALEIFDCAAYFGIESLGESLMMYQNVLYRKRFTYLKEKLDKEQFRKLKQYAVTYFNKNFHPSEDKHFAFTSTNNCAYFEERDGERYLHHNQIPPTGILFGTGIKNVAWYKDEVHEELTRCLTHDLCELGFGTFCYYGFSFDCSANGAEIAFVMQ
ncbi:BTB/POZ domain-containing protein KCTD7-like [Mercenaria mercenaria]|uniref:BTB/POZ domain-containing protein KCTD7-like n=1 Tax=Mercenaria mercenaria TaxID=6596 RepID=UPI00234F439D|nr:BTB/POZ domain-containing protein KCTD7-like [Mercenaria mercenaria]